MASLLYTIFFISGASALIFETLWFRQAGLAFGNSVWASSLVLSGFMAGLALGSALAARERGGFKNPIRLYALLELAIAGTGVALVYLLPHVGVVLAPWFLPILERPWLLNPLRLLLAFSFLLIPSIAMGLSLPLLTKALSAFDPLFGRVLGKLYGWNTLGAVLGVVLTEFVLISAAGVRGTAWFAGVLNVGVAGIAIWMPRWGEGGRMVQSASQPQTALPPTVQWSKGYRYLLAAFLAGFCLLALEIIWFRFLLLFLSSYSESFAVMLAVILTGIALGGFAGSQALRRWPESYRETSTCAFVTGFLCILTYSLFPIVIGPYSSAPIRQALDILWVALPLMFPVSFLSGIFFTFLGTALRNHLPSEMATTGRLTFANTTGAALGSFSAGFLFLPSFGMERSLYVIAALYGVLGIFLLTGKSSVQRAAIVSAAGFGLGILFFPFGTMETQHLQVPVKRLLTKEGGRIVAVREGVIETITYLEHLWGDKPFFYRLITNSYSMSSSDIRSRRYMKLFVYWPLAVHPDPKRALLISYGIGSTARGR